MKIVQPASAGKYERNDAFVEIQPGKGISMDITCSAPSLVKGNIERELMAVLNEFGIQDARVKVMERGALPWVLRSRVEAAIMRAGVSE